MVAERGLVLAGPTGAARRPSVRRRRPTLLLSLAVEVGAARQLRLRRVVRKVLGAPDGHPRPQPTRPVTLRPHRRRRRRWHRPRRRRRPSPTRRAATAALGRGVPGPSAVRVIDAAGRGVLGFAFCFGSACDASAAATCAKRPTTKAAWSAGKTAAAPRPCRTGGTCAARAAAGAAARACRWRAASSGPRSLPRRPRPTRCALSAAEPGATASPSAAAASSASDEDELRGARARPRATGSVGDAHVGDVGDDAGLRGVPSTEGPSSRHERPNWRSVAPSWLSRSAARAEVAVQQADELGGRRAEAAAPLRRGEHLGAARRRRRGCARGTAAADGCSAARKPRRAQLAREVLAAAAVDARAR